MHFDHLFGHYKRSKYLAEHEVLRAGAAGLPVVLVHPTFPVGERDSAPTPTGRTILEFLNGRIPAYVDTALNVVHVDDVAAGHVLAAATRRARAQLRARRREHDAPADAGTLGGRAGLKAPRVRLEPACRAARSCAAPSGSSRRVLRREPTLSDRTGADGDDAHGIRRHSGAHRARLHEHPGPRRRCAEAAEWYLDHGFVKPAHAGAHPGSREAAVSDEPNGAPFDVRALLEARAAPRRSHCTSAT